MRAVKQPIDVRQCTHELKDTLESANKIDIAIIFIKITFNISVILANTNYPTDTVGHNAVAS